jgi:hypothetical protein
MPDTHVDRAVNDLIQTTVAAGIAPATITAHMKPRE